MKKVKRIETAVSATVVFRAIRSAVEAYSRGWKPLGWVVKEGRRYAGLRMAPPTPMNVKGVKSAAERIKVDSLDRGGDRPWKAEHELAYQAIAGEFGPRPGLGSTGGLRFAVADIVSAFGKRPIGTKVLDREALLAATAKAVEAYDPKEDRVPGQHFVMCPEGKPFVSAGVGRRTRNAEDFILRNGRFGVEAYLKREKAAEVDSLALVVYTAGAYLADPDLQKPEEADERTRIEKSDCTHVIVAVLAFAGPKSPLPPATFVHNLAGGNHEAAQWNADEIHNIAQQVEAYWDEWCIVAD